MKEHDNDKDNEIPDKPETNSLSLQHPNDTDDDIPTPIPAAIADGGDATNFSPMLASYFGYPPPSIDSLIVSRSSSTISNVTAENITHHKAYTQSTKTAAEQVDEYGFPILNDDYQDSPAAANNATYNNHEVDVTVIPRNTSMLDYYSTDPEQQMALLRSLQNANTSYTHHDPYAFNHDLWIDHELALMLHFYGDKPDVDWNEFLQHAA